MVKNMNKCFKVGNVYNIEWFGKKRVVNKWDGALLVKEDSNYYYFGLPFGGYFLGFIDCRTFKVRKHAIYKMELYDK